MANSENITVTRIETLSQFEDLREIWSNLLAQSSHRDIFLTWEWLFAWWKNIDQFENQLWILLFHEGERLIGIAPLMLGKKKRLSIPFRWLGNIGNCDIGGMITLNSDKTMPALFNYLQEHKNQWDVFEFSELNSDSLFTQQFIQFADASQNFVYMHENQHFYIPLTDVSWDDYYNNLSKNMKHNLKRRMKRLAEMGDVKFNKYIGETLQWQHFEQVFAVNKNSHFPQTYQPERQQAFHREMFELMREKGWIQIETLTVNERPIAFQYGFCYENRYEDWRGGIDKEFETLAPGKLLMLFSLEEKIKCRISENDFLRGVYSYKEDWKPLYRTFVNVQIYNRIGIKARFGYFWQKHLKPVVREWQENLKVKKTAEGE